MDGRSIASLIPPATPLPPDVYLRLPIPPSSIQPVAPMSAEGGLSVILRSSCGGGEDRDGGGRGGGRGGCEGEGRGFRLAMGQSPVRCDVTAVPEAEGAAVRLGEWDLRPCRGDNLLVLPGGALAPPGTGAAGTMLLALSSCHIAVNAEECGGGGFLPVRAHPAAFAFALPPGAGPRALEEEEEEEEEEGGEGGREEYQLLADISVEFDLSLAREAYEELVSLRNGGNGPSPSPAAAAAEPDLLLQAAMEREVFHLDLMLGFLAAIVLALIGAYACVVRAALRREEGGGGGGGYSRSPLSKLSEAEPPMAKSSAAQWHEKMSDRTAPRGADGRQLGESLLMENWQSLGSQGGRIRKKARVDGGAPCRSSRRRVLTPLSHATGGVGGANLPLSFVDEITHYLSHPHSCGGGGEFRPCEAVEPIENILLQEFW